jgi:hypothetical protein
MQAVIAAVFFLVAETLHARVGAGTFNGLTGLALAVGAAGFQPVAVLTVGTVDVESAPGGNAHLLDHVPRLACRALGRIRILGRIPRAGKNQNRQKTKQNLDYSLHGYKYSLHQEATNG